MIKRATTLIICGLISFGLMGCTNSANTQSQDTVQNQEVAQNQDTTQKQNATQDNAKANTVIMDDEYVKITYLGYSENSDKIPVLKLSIENKSEMAYAVQTEEVSAGDQMASVYFSEHPEPGAKVEAEMALEEVEQAFGTVEGKFVLVDKDYNTVDENPFKIELDNGVIASENEPEGVVLVDDEYTKITYLGFFDEDFVGPSAKLSIQNKSDKTIVVLTDKFYADGNEVETMLSGDRIAPSKRGKSGLRLYAEDDFKTIKGTFVINDAENNTIVQEQVEFDVN